ncbi:MAG: CoA transferase subunit A [Candidatus Hodarchaeales archaeon]
MVKIDTVSNIVNEIIKPSTKIAIGGGAMFLKPMEIVREIIRQKITDLHVVTLIGDLDVDLLIGVNAVSELDSCYIGLPMIGNIIFNEWTEFSMVRALQAGAMGTPAIMLRSILGSDFVNREDFKEVIYNDKPYIEVPAINPDIAIIHAYKGDQNGNVFYPKHHSLDYFSTLPAKAASELFVSVEKIISNEDGRKLVEHGHGVMFSSLDVDYLAEAPKGAFPTGFPPLYASEMGHLMTYSGMQQAGMFSQYLEEHVYLTQQEEKP